jgi:hypothetical protein
MSKTDPSEPVTCPERPDRHFPTISSEDLGVVTKPLTLREKAWNNGALRKTALLILLGVLWDRLGVCLAHPDRRRTCLRGQRGARGAGLVHL